MVHTCITARNSTGHEPASQLAPHDVTPPQPQESQPDSPQLIPHDEEHFEIEIMVPERPKAQDALAEQPKQQQGEGAEEDDDDEYAPLSDLENEKFYHNTVERESYKVEALVPISRL
jgi:hypothetical protein